MGGEIEGIRIAGFANNARPDFHAHINNNIHHENDELVQEQDRRKSFNLDNFFIGFLTGIIKETFTLLLFVPKLIFNLITNPIGTIKGLINGFSNLIKLVSNPKELMKALSKAWETFCNADSDKKGEILGKIFANFVSMPVLGNPLLLNARLISLFKSAKISIGAVIKSRTHLAEFYKECGSMWKTFNEARRIAWKARVEAHYKRALKLEGIPEELAPQLIFLEKMPPGLSNTKGGYISPIHTIIINTEKRNIFLTAYDWLKGNSTGKIIRHEVKHAGQALHAASAGGKVPLIRPRRELISLIRDEVLAGGKRKFEKLPISEKIRLHRAAKEELIINRNQYTFLPEDIWEKAAKLKPKIKTKIPAVEIPSKLLDGSKFSKQCREYPAHFPQMLEKYVKLKFKGKPSLYEKGQTLYEKGAERCRKFDKAIMSKIPKNLRGPARAMVGIPIAIAGIFYCFVPLIPAALKLLFPGLRFLRKFGLKMKKLFKQYKNCHVEAEAFRVQAKYIGLGPRFYSPSIHNIDRLSNLRIETDLDVAEITNRGRPNPEREVITVSNQNINPAHLKHGLQLNQAV